MAKYPYLNDKNFLLMLDNLQTKEIFVKVTVLNWYEKEKGSIEGLVTNGTLNIDGNSSVRRTCSLSMSVGENNPQELSIGHIKELISIDKKIKLEIGITNTTNQYTQYEKIWYPMGLFIITEVSYSHSLQGININLNLKDKMCMLNGFCGGVLPASTNFHEAEIVTDEGVVIVEHPTIYQIIQEAVHHWGGEDLNRIIINDIKTEIRQATNWGGEKDRQYLVYHLINGETQPDWWYMLNKKDLTVFLNQGKEALEEDEETENTEEIEDSDIINSSEENLIIWDEITHEYPDKDGLGVTYIYGYKDDLGYRYTDFIFNEDLIGQAGDNLCTILDKIKNKLGNYEYYYDLEGNFIFQEKRNFLNIAPEDFNQEFKDYHGYIDMDRYMVQYDSGAVAYNFNDGNIITSYSNSPKYDKIKNDYTIWGKKNGLRYHLVIDTKPEYGYIPYSYAVIPLEENSVALEKNIKFLKFEMPSIGNSGYIYEKEDGTYWAWRTTEELQKIVEKKITKYSQQIKTFETTAKKLIEDGKNSTNTEISSLASTVEGVLFGLEEEPSSAEVTTEGTDSSTSTTETIITIKYSSSSITSIMNDLITLCEKFPYSVFSYFPYIDIFLKEISDVITNFSKVIELQDEAQMILKILVGLEEGDTEGLTAADAAEKLKEAVYTYLPKTEVAYKQLYKRIMGKDYDTGSSIVEVGFYDMKTIKWALEFDSNSPRRLEACYQQIDIEAQGIQIVKNEVTQDWREELFLQGLENEMLNITPSFYYIELKSEWTKIYDMVKHKFHDDFLNNPWSYNFFLDFIDTDAPISALRVDEIGKRQVVSVVESVNCLFEPSPKNIMLINMDEPTAKEQKERAEDEGYTPLLLPTEIFTNLGVGGGKNSAFEYIKSMLHDWTSYNEAITIQCLPIYYLEPNTRIKVHDAESNIYGEYVISSMSIPLDVNGTMSITATRALERL